MSNTGGFVDKMFDRFKGTMLHFENVHDSLTDAHLTAIFSGYGVVSSCKVVIVFHLVPYSFWQLSSSFLLFLLIFFFNRTT